MAIFLFTLMIVFIFIYIRYKSKYFFNKIKSIIFIFIVSLLVFFIILYPKDIIDAAQNGISLWANVVLPSLLPFFIGAELLVGLGFVKFIGVLIEPLIRPIFNVPGEASFIFAMSITSGYPMGIKLTTDLRKKDIISKGEAQRIMSFCSTSGPLFMVGAVAIGMFNSPQIGLYIAIAHYLGAITVGIIYRFIFKEYRYAQHNNRNVRINIFKKALNEMLLERKRDGRAIGKLLSDSVKESVSTLVIVGGMIVTFSVITRELYLIGFFNYIFSVIKLLSVNSIHISKELIEVLLTGSIEITTGCKLASEALQITPVIQITLATMIISWSGLSVHAQAASIISSTDINIKMYVLSKLMHSLFSGIYVYILLIYSKFSINSIIIETFSNNVAKTTSYSWINKLMFSTNMFLIIIITLVIIGLVLGLFKIIKNS